MAQYEAPQAATLTQIFEPAGKLTLNAETFKAIKAILGDSTTVAEMNADGTIVGGGKAAVAFADPTQPLLNAPDAKSGVQVVIMQDVQPTSETGLDALADPTPGAAADLFLDANSTVKSVIMNSADGNRVIFTNNDVDAVVTTGVGKGTIVYTAGGDDLITFNGGESTNPYAKNASATINTGEGNDTVILAGDQGAVNLSGGSGNMVVRLNSSAINATIDAGDGFDYIRTGQNIDLGSANLDFADGQFTMTTGGELKMTNVEMVVFDPFQRGEITWQDDVAVLADTWQESIIAKLYNVALGRSVLDGRDGVLSKEGAMGGIQFWDDYIAANPAIDAKQLANSFLNCSQFHAKTDTMTNADFVKYLFGNLDLTTKDIITDNAGNEHTYQSYVDALNAAGATSADNMDVRYDTALQIANSQSTIDVLGADGKQYVIDGDFTNLA